MRTITLASWIATSRFHNQVHAPASRWNETKGVQHPVNKYAEETGCIYKIYALFTRHLIFKVLNWCFKEGSNIYIYAVYTNLNVYKKHNIEPDNIPRSLIWLDFLMHKNVFKVFNKKYLKKR